MPTTQSRPIRISPAKINTLASAEAPPKAIFFKKIRIAKRLQVPNSQKRETYFGTISRVDLIENKELFLAEYDDGESERICLNQLQEMVENYKQESADDYGKMENENRYIYDEDNNIEDNYDSSDDEIDNENKHSHCVDKEILTKTLKKNDGKNDNKRVIEIEMDKRKVTEDEKYKNETSSEMTELPQAKRQRLSSTRKAVDDYLYSVHPNKRLTSLRVLKNLLLCNKSNEGLNNEALSDGIASALCLKLGYATFMNTRDEVCDILKLLASIFSHCSSRVLDESFVEVGGSLLDIVVNIFYQEWDDTYAILCMNLVLQLLRNGGDDAVAHAILNKRDFMNALLEACNSYQSDNIVTIAIKILSKFASSSNHNVREKLRRYPSILTSLSSFCLPQTREQQMLLENSEDKQQLPSPQKEAEATIRDLFFAGSTTYENENKTDDPKVSINMRSEMLRDLLELINGVNQDGTEHDDNDYGIAIACIALDHHDSRLHEEEINEGIDIAIWTKLNSSFGKVFQNSTNNAQQYLKVHKALFAIDMVYRCKSQDKFRNMEMFANNLIEMLLKLTNSLTSIVCDIQSTLPKSMDLPEAPCRYSIKSQRENIITLRKEKYYDSTFVSVVLMQNSIERCLRMLEDICDDSALCFRTALVEADGLLPTLKAVLDYYYKDELYSTSAMNNRVMRIKQHAMGILSHASLSSTPLRIAMANHPGLLDTLAQSINYHYANITHDHHTFIQNASQALQNIATCTENMTTLSQNPLVISTIVTLISSKSSTVTARRCAAGTIQNLAYTPESRDDLTKHTEHLKTIISSLASILSYPDYELLLKAVSALRNLSSCDESVKFMTEDMEVMSAIAKVSVSGNEIIGKHGSAILKKLMPVMDAGSVRKLLLCLASAERSNSNVEHDLIQ